MDESVLSELQDQIELNYEQYRTNIGGLENIDVVDPEDKADDQFVEHLTKAEGVSEASKCLNADEVQADKEKKINCIPVEIIEEEEDKPVEEEEDSTMKQCDNADRRPFLEFLRSFRQDHPRLSRRDAVSCASCVWNKLPSFCKSVYSSVEPEDGLIPHSGEAFSLKRSCSSDAFEERFCQCPSQQDVLYSANRSPTVSRAQQKLVTATEYDPCKSSPQFRIHASIKKGSIKDGSVSDRGSIRKASIKRRSIKSRSIKEEGSSKRRSNKRGSINENSDKRGSIRRASNKDRTEKTRNNYKMFKFIREYRDNHPNMSMNKCMTSGLKAFQKMCEKREKEMNKIKERKSSLKTKKKKRSASRKTAIKSFAQFHRTPKAKGSSSRGKRSREMSLDSIMNPNSRHGSFKSSKSDTPFDLPRFNQSPSLDNRAFVTPEFISEPNSMISLATEKSEDSYVTPCNQSRLTPATTTEKSISHPSLSQNASFAKFLEIYRIRHPEKSCEESLRGAECEWSKLPENCRQIYRCRRDVRTPTHLTPTPTPSKKPQEKGAKKKSGGAKKAKISVTKRPINKRSKSSALKKALNRSRSNALNKKAKVQVKGSKSSRIERSGSGAAALKIPQSESSANASSFSKQQFNFNVIVDMIRDMDGLDFNVKLCKIY